MTSSSRGERGDMFVEHQTSDGGHSLLVKYWYAADRYLVQSWPGVHRLEVLDKICGSIRENKPSRVFVVTGDKQHKISSTTVALIIEGKMTSADLLAE